jgi:WD40 repeat protein
MSKKLEQEIVIEFTDFKPTCMINIKNLILCGSRDGQLAIIDINNNHSKKVEETNLGSVECLLSDPKNNIFLAGGQKTIQIFTINGSEIKVKKTLEGHDDSVIGLGIFQSKLISASEDSKVLRWEYLSSNEINPEEIYQHDSPIICFDVEPNTGNIVSCCSEPKMKIFMADRHYNTRINHDVIDLETKVWAVKFLPESKGIVCGEHEGNIFILKNNAKVKIVNFHDCRVKSLSISSDNRYIVSGSFDQNIKVFDIDLNEESVGEGHQDWIRSVLFISNNKIISTGDDQKLIIWKSILAPRKKKKCCSACCSLF